MRRVDDDRQMRAFLDDRDNTQIQRVARVFLKCPDAAFAQASIKAYYERQGLLYDIHRELKGR